MSQDRVHRPQLLKKKESRSVPSRGPSAYQPTALMLGHTGTVTCDKRLVSLLKSEEQRYTKAINSNNFSLKLLLLIAFI